jgi:hypothetical protein
MAGISGNLEGASGETFSILAIYTSNKKFFEF